MDDIFGGASTYEHTQRLKMEVIATGQITTARANLSKCLGPSQILKILGMMYDAVAKQCSLPQPKIEKYICRINAVLKAASTSSKDFEILVGNLVWASYVEPWGRPFLSAISCHISRGAPSVRHRLNRYTRMALLIWKRILRAGVGVSFQ